MDTEATHVELWSASGCGDGTTYCVCDMMEPQYTFVVRIARDEAIIEGGNAQVRSDVRAARIRVVAKRAHRNPHRRATLEARSGEAPPTE